MARKRSLSTKISTDKAVNKLASDYGPMAVLLYTWMIPHAEDDRSITSDPEEILLTVIPGFQSKVTIDEVQTYLNAMVSIGLIEDWGNGRLYFPESFYEHQTYIPANRRNHRKTPQNTEIYQTSPQNTAKHSKTQQNATSLSLSLSLIEDDERAREGKIFEFYQQNVGLITRNQAELISSYLEDGMSPELIIKVIEDSLGKSDKWSWIKTVLKNSLESNIKTVSDYEAKKLEMKQARGHPPGKLRDKDDQIKKATDEAFEELRREGLIDDTGRGHEDNRPP